MIKKHTKVLVGLALFLASTVGCSVFASSASSYLPRERPYHVPWPAVNHARGVVQTMKSHAFYQDAFFPAQIDCEGVDGLQAWQELSDDHEIDTVAQWIVADLAPYKHLSWAALEELARIFSTPAIDPVNKPLPWRKIKTIRGIIETMQENSFYDSFPCGADRSDDEHALSELQKRRNRQEVLDFVFSEALPYKASSLANLNQLEGILGPQRAVLNYHPQAIPPADDDDGHADF